MQLSYVLYLIGSRQPSYKVCRRTNSQVPLAQQIDEIRRFLDNTKGANHDPVELTSNFINWIGNNAPNEPLPVLCTDSLRTSEAELYVVRCDSLDEAGLPLVERGGVAVYLKLPRNAAATTAAAVLRKCPVSLETSTVVPLAEGDVTTLATAGFRSHVRPVSVEVVGLDESRPDRATVVAGSLPAFETTSWPPRIRPVALDARSILAAADTLDMDDNGRDIRSWGLHEEVTWPEPEPTK